MLTSPATSIISPDRLGYSTAELARMLARNPKYVERDIRAGRIVAQMIGSMYIVPPAEVKRLVPGVQG